MCATAALLAAHRNMFNTPSLPMFCVLVHLSIYASSSYIEEEHHFWYYAMSTVFVWNAVHSLRNSTIARKWACAVVLLRALRNMHQTGVKYIHLTDVSDWLDRFS
jgi:hypothetical protein